ncbi:N-acyl homoserine lactonase family protein [Cnuibacter physcomitrellae]|uniref:N-acyl homoserine lactonase family protein n=1 Tax=Cnuibacter physcomitrellae TaxID=1619308 RepID=UPI002175B0A7|nr:N-acyl homoserine lactonase family protein [Cnuibacter physcomitrellae]MCS5498313.1 N-acyl homoserine lactonase family protein [Cnuibacter physcomitrellae]
MALTIHALSVGRVFDLGKPSFLYLRGWAERIDVPNIMFVITGGESPIVVDTGGDPDRSRDVHRLRMERDPQEHPAEAARSVGVDPRDVRWVVNTHLHWDHSSNNHLFPNAQVVVQRVELEFARRPVTWHQRNFEALPGMTPSWEDEATRFRVVDGETELAPGVTLVPLPGHTPGSQGVLVETAGATYLLAGDCVYLYENWEGDETWRHIPAGIYTDLEEYQRSFDRIDALDCEVVPSHDWRVIDRGVFE